ncbi:alpha/beta hydrolase [Arthrobacter sp. B2a2-09]|uniref:alpha/beta hydrolase n=1 Tax=Arthrobacter sp. B2a2-09 TaxID=2952822 RepID=UPI0022CD6664|nr:alpha/beta hydrolase [Arthrobacter sp. B2a2-09]MCZ9880603.1 alpha/beta hydrolase [Arthrobacter sp. B2a2-09]
MSSDSPQPPIPSTISQQAQAILAMPAQEQPEWPQDKEALAAMFDMINASIPPESAGPMVSSLYGAADTGVPCESELVKVNDVSVYVCTPEGVSTDDPRVFMTIHGAWTYGAGHLSRLGGEMVAGGLGVRTWSVDYRMPPRHPFPAPLDDCVAVYRKVLEDHRPEDIIIGGMSGGANLTTATILRAREEGLPLPAGAVIHSPPIDLTMSGDSYNINAAGDTTYTSDGLEKVFRLYLNGHDRTDPYVSPLFGDFTRGFPPSLLTAGTRDFLLSDTVRLHRKLRAAGVPAELHVWEAAPHFLFMGTAPEDLERVHETRRWVEERFAAKHA